MRTLLRKIPSGLYFQGPDKWTNDPSKALNFKSINRALRFIEIWSMKDVELVFSFHGTNLVTRVSPEKIALDYVEP